MRHKWSVGRVDVTYGSIHYYIYICDKKSFLAFTNKFSNLFTAGVREHQSNVTCFELVRSHQTCILDGCMGEGWPSTHDPALNGWTRRSHQLGQQIYIYSLPKFSPSLELVTSIINIYIFIIYIYKSKKTQNNNILLVRQCSGFLLSSFYIF